MGIRLASRFLCRLGDSNLHWAMDIYPHTHPRCHAHPFHCPEHVGLPPRNGRGRKTSDTLGRSFLCMSRSRPDAEKSHWCCLPARSGHLVLVFHWAIVFAANLAEVTPHFGRSPGPADCGALAYPRDDPQPALLHLDTQEHGRSLSWFSLVLLHQ